MNKLTLTHESSVTETVQETHCNVIDNGNQMATKWQPSIRFRYRFRYR